MDHHQARHTAGEDGKRIRAVAARCWPRREPADGARRARSPNMMIQDFKRRFWMSLVLTIPIFCLLHLLAGFN